MLPDAPVDGESKLFVADQNLIFGLESLEGSDQMYLMHLNLRMLNGTIFQGNTLIPSGVPVLL